MGSRSWMRRSQRTRSLSHGLVVTLIISLISQVLCTLMVGWLL